MTPISVFSEYQGDSADLVDGREAAEIIGLRHRQEFKTIRTALGIRPAHTEKRGKRSKTPCQFFSRAEVTELAEFLRKVRHYGWRHYSPEAQAWNIS